MSNVLAIKKYRALGLGLGAISLSTMAASAQAVQEKNFLQQWIIDGGITMIPIVIVLFAIIALVVYNAMALKRDKFIPADLKANLLQLMAECRVRSAIELAATSPSYMGRLAAYALPNVDAHQPETLGRDQVEDAIADFVANESRRIQPWLNMLSLCAQVSPMLGLFGTVQGMVGAFASLGRTGQADPAQLAGDISVALLTTFWGLVNAIIAVPCYFFMKGKASNLVAEAVGSVEEMVNTSINTINAEAQLSRIPEGLA